MNEYFKIAIILFFSSFFINLILTWFLIKYSSFLNLLDHPNERKIHFDSVPVVGGIGIFLTIFLFFSFFVYNGFVQNIFNNQEIISISISTCLIIMIGIMDDSFGLGPFNKFLFQIIAAIIVLVGLDIHSTPIFSFIDSYYFNFLINTFFIVGITNAFNLIDGLDGLAGGVSIIICLTLLILFVLSGYGVVQISFFVLLLGCLSSFLIFNMSPAKTFLGDTGSLFLGWYFALTSVYFAEKTALSLAILLPFMILGLPAFDVLFVMLSRFIKRHKYKMPFLDRLKLVFKPDNSHLHHLLIRGGISKFKSVVILYFITLITSLVCIYFWINRESVNFSYGLIFILLLIFFIRSFVEWKIRARK